MTDKKPDSNTGRPNLKHYFGKTARHGATWAAMLMATTFTVGTFTTDALRDDLDNSASAPEVVQQFEQRMADLKSQRAELDYLQTLSDAGNLPADADFAAKQRDYRNGVYGFLSDIMIDDAASRLSEIEKADLVNRFHFEVDDVQKFGFLPLTEGAAAHLDQFRAPDSRYDINNDISRIDMAQDINKNAWAEESSNMTWGFLAMMMWSLMLFPNLRQWKNMSGPKKWASEPPRKPSPPKFKH